MQAFSFPSDCVIMMGKDGENMKYVYAVIFLVVLIGLYVGSYLLNARTKPPEGCELPADFSGCSACHSASCGVRKQPPKEGGPHAE
jgi:hypothetical protein